MSLATSTPAQSHVVARNTSGSIDRDWRTLSRWIAFYSWTTIGATLYGLTIAHLFSVVGTSWTNCPNGIAVIAVHLFEVPLALFPLFVAYFGIRRLSADNRHLYRDLLGFANITNLVFFLFEVDLVIGGTHRGVPDTDSWLTLSIAAILLSAVVLGFAIRLRMTHLLRGERVA